LKNVINGEIEMNIDGEIVLKIRNCLNCGKVPQRQYKTEKQEATIRGEFDWDSFKTHIGKYDDSQAPKTKEWDKFSIKKSVFPDWPETNAVVVKEQRYSFNYRKRELWDGESYRPQKVDGYFCSNKCAVNFAVNTAIAMED